MFHPEVAQHLMRLVAGHKYSEPELTALAEEFCGLHRPRLSEVRSSYVTRREEERREEERRGYFCIADVFIAFRDASAKAQLGEVLLW